MTVAPKILGVRRGRHSYAARPTYAQEVHYDDPVGFWDGQEPSGTTMYDYRGGREMVGAGTATTNSLRVMDQAWTAWAYNGNASANVSRTDESWMSPHAGASGQMTLEAWINCDTLATIRTLWWKGVAASNMFEYSFAVTTTGVLQFVVFTLAGGVAGQVDSSAGVIAAATDYHVAGTYDRAGNAIKVYVNGALSATAATSADSGNGTAPLVFGKRASASNDRYFLGRASHLAIYPKALAADRIAGHYNAAKRR